MIEDYVFYLREDSMHAKAISDYEVTDERLLGFKKDEVITVTKKDPNGNIMVQLFCLISYFSEVLFV